MTPEPAKRIVLLGGRQDGHIIEAKNNGRVVKSLDEIPAGCDTYVNTGRYDSTYAQIYELRSIEDFE